MTVPKPRLVWVNTKEDDTELGYFNPDLDELLHIPGVNQYLGRSLHCVQGNALRRRKVNVDTLNIWYIDEDLDSARWATNKSLHGTVPTLIGDTWGEKIWKGPLVAVMKSGHEWDPRRVMDITLTGYRDAIDFLGYYRDGYGSMIDGIGSRAHLATRILEDRAKKVRGVRINCVRDQEKQTGVDLVEVEVPKTHPLFNLEGDDPFAIPDRVGYPWVAKSYEGGKRVVEGGEETDESMVDKGLANPLARLLLLQANEYISNTGEGWGSIHSWWHDPAIGSILIVNRRWGDVTAKQVRGMCQFIEQVVAPLLTEERGCSREKRMETLAMVTKDRLAPFLV
jgi:hypothetical protein